MSNISWTDAQRQAIFARGGPLLVSAAAGSGKTAVLVQRVIEIITAKEPVDIDRFLIVTFTNAAAEEMRQRIADRLEAMLHDDPFNENLIRQQLLLSKAQISTIDSFCNSLAREYFYALDIPADFRIADDEERSVMKDAAMNAVFDGKYAAADLTFLRLVDTFSSTQDDAPLRELVGNIYGFLGSQPFPERWLSRQLSAFSCEGDPAETPWGRQIIGEALSKVGFAKVQSKKMTETIPEDMTVLSGVRELAVSENAMILRLEKALSGGRWDDIVSAVRALSYARFPSPKKLGESEAEVKNEAKAYRDRYKSALEKLPVLFSKDAGSFREEIREAGTTVVGLFELASAFEKEYGRIKSERGVAEFGDVEHWALRLLVKEDGVTFTEKAAEVAQRYDYVMVDEYQDTNLLQDLIFRAVSDNDKKLFIVGDVKQSIYRFRQSNPEIFISRKDKSLPYDENAPCFPSKINLDANFRSRRGVTDCVNYVFSRLMTKEASELDYTADEELKPMAAYPEDTGAAASLCLLESSAGGEESAAEEARFIAGEIYRIMSEEKISGRDGLRAPAFSDFCILLRTKKYAHVYARELLRLGIPNICEKGESFLLRPEIRLMVSLLRAIDNPARDISLASVLLSPLFGFTADDLGRLRAAHRELDLYEMLLAERETNEKAERFLSTLERLRTYGSNMPADEFISLVYNETLLPEIVLSGEDGEFRRKNLRLLVRYARKYESSGFRGLSGFVKLLDKLGENEFELSAADRTGENAANAVSIMTIHKSKGLEFPVCIVARLAGDFSDKDAKAPIVLHDKLGMGVSMIGGNGTFRYKGLTRRAVESAKAADLRAEELRLLYVAMTRARERLLLVASVKNIQQKLTLVGGRLDDGRTVSPYSFAAANSFCDWLLSCRVMQERDGADIWRFREVRLSADAEPEGEAPDEAEASREPLPDEAEVKSELRRIEEKLARRYPYARASLIPVKITASAAAERESGGLRCEMSRPAFLSEGEMSGSERGTALHAFVQHCDLEKAALSVADEKRRLVDSGFLTQRQADCVNERRVGEFLASPLCSEMKAAQMLEREYQFTVEIPAVLADSTLTPPLGEERIVLQGAIDALYELDGCLTIVDYKTDRASSPDELSSRYAPQLALYSRAVGEIFGRPADRCVIYSFSLGCEIEVEVGE